MTRDQAWRLVAETTQQWAQDQDSDIVWAGEYEGRRGIRMAQQCRDFTTMWFDIGERTVGFEAYLLPQPPNSREQVYRLCLARNYRAWPAFMAMDDGGDLYIRGRIPLEGLSAETLDGAIGAVYEMVELSFRTLVDLGFRSREKSS